MSKPSKEAVEVCNTLILHNQVSHHLGSKVYCSNGGLRECNAAVIQSAIDAATAEIQRRKLGKEQAEIDKRAEQIMAAIDGKAGAMTGTVSDAIEEQEEKRRNRYDKERTEGASGLKRLVEAVKALEGQEIEYGLAKELSAALREVERET